jgi:hypothetical protein
MIFISPFYPATQKPIPPRVLASGSVTVQVFNLAFDPEYPFAGSEGWDLVINCLQDITKEVKIDTQFKTEGDELTIVT